MGPELDLRSQLERLDRLICRSEGIDPGALTFASRPLWHLDAPSKAALALSKARATQIYAGLGLWPAEVLAKLVEAQLVADGTYPSAAAVFAEAGAVTDVGKTQPTLDFSPTQPRDLWGRWTSGSAGPFIATWPSACSDAQSSGMRTRVRRVRPARRAALRSILSSAHRRCPSAGRSAAHDRVIDDLTPSRSRRPLPVPYTVPSPADLAARFPAFAAVPPAALAGAIAEARTRVDTSWLPGDYPIAVMLLAAHTLTLDGLGTGAEAAAAAAGTLGYASLRSGGLSLDRQRPPRGAAEPSILAETTYGRRFLALLKVNQLAVLVP